MEYVTKNHPMVLFFMDIPMQIGLAAKKLADPPLVIATSWLEVSFDGAARNNSQWHFPLLNPSTWHWQKLQLRQSG